VVQRGILPFKMGRTQKLITPRRRLSSFAKGTSFLENGPDMMRTF